MGLDVSCGQKGFRAGSYSGFGAFRTKLMKDAFACELDDYEGFGGGEKWDSSRIKKHKYADLAILLNHSDCDGAITNTESAKLLKALKAYRKDNDGMVVSDVSPENERYWSLIDQWIELCSESVKTKQHIIFG